MDFSPGGHALATASGDDTTRLWETNVNDVAAGICNITPAITKSKWDQYMPGLTYRSPCACATCFGDCGWRRFIVCVGSDRRLRDGLTPHSARGTA